MNTHRPGAPLDRFVEVIWLHETHAPAAPELALPTATVELVIDLVDDRVRVFPAHALGDPLLIPGPMLCGPHVRPFAIDNSVPGRVLGVHFRPGGAAALLPGGLHELANQHVALDQLLGWQARALRDAVARVGRNPAALFAVVESFLLGLVRCNVHPAVRDALDHMRGPPINVGTLVDRSGYSHRRFNELFRQAVGMGAKRYARIARFQHALHLVERCSAAVDWSSIASVCGYYDQSHLIHEFRAHAAMSPREYLASRGERLNHPLLPDRAAG